MSDPTPLTVVPIETPSLGDRSYLVHDGRAVLLLQWNVFYSGR